MLLPVLLAHEFYFLVQILRYLMIHSRIHHSVHLLSLMFYGDRAVQNVFLLILTDDVAVFYSIFYLLEIDLIQFLKFLCFVKIHQDQDMLYVQEV